MSSTSDRTWFVQMNLDEYNALSQSLWSDADRAAAFQGLGLGCNAGQCPNDAPSVFRRAWEIGVQWRDKAEANRIKNSIAGKASAASRSAKTGSAQPTRNHSLIPTDPEQPSNTRSNDDRTIVRELLEPNHKPVPITSLPTIEEPLPPLPPKGGRKKKAKFQTEDISLENAPFLQEVYKSVPADHPVTGDQVHKGAYATAARYFQGIVDSGEATARELRSIGLLYYRAEKFQRRYGIDWQEKTTQAWDTRPKAMMHVASLYGPEKRPYRQILPVAQLLIRLTDESKNPSPDDDPAPMTPPRPPAPPQRALEPITQDMTALAIAKDREGPLPGWIKTAKREEAS